jgi:hypothetical protein
MTHVTSQVISVASWPEHEGAYLLWVHGRLVALLVEAESGWFLQFGLGPFEAEGLIFASLGDAEDWVRRCIPPGWPDRSRNRENWTAVDAAQHCCGPS